MNNKAVVYPYITSEKNILNGVPIIEGTRIPVLSIAGYYQMEEFAEYLNTLPDAAKEKFQSFMSEISANN